MMVSKNFKVIALLATFVSSLLVAKSKDAGTIEWVTAAQDLSKEKQLFIDFCSYLYAPLNKNTPKDQVTAYLTNTFNTEMESFKQGKARMLRMTSNGQLVAWALVAPASDKANCSHLWRAAVDLNVDNKADLAGKLVEFIFEQNPGVTSVANVCLKNSTVEHQLLKSCGFKECALISKKYDASKYTSFEFVKEGKAMEAKNVAPEVKAGQLYKHYKGKQYKVIGLANHSETLEKMVVYQALYETPEFGKDALWVRPAKMFSETIEINGKVQPRFELVA